MIKCQFVNVLWFTGLHFEQTHVVIGNAIRTTDGVDVTCARCWTFARCRVVYHGAFGFGVAARVLAKIFGFWLIRALE